jgi:hypothetical protein
MQSIIYGIVNLIYGSYEANFGHRTKNLYFRYTPELLWWVKLKPTPVNVNFVVDKMALGHIFL